MLEILKRRMYSDFLNSIYSLPLFDLFKVPDNFEATLRFSDFKLELVPGGGFPSKA